MDICKKKRMAKNAATNRTETPNSANSPGISGIATGRKKGLENSGTSFEVDNLMATSTVEGQKARAFGCPQSSS